MHLSCFGGPKKDLKKTHSFPNIDIHTMANKAEVTNRSGSIKVGTTGTIGTLMSKELETMKNKPKVPSTSQRKFQTRSISLPCGKPKKRRNSSAEAGIGTNGSDKRNSYDRSMKNAENPKFKPRKNGRGVPMLDSEDASTDRSRDTNADKKGHAKIAEVVDVKCNNPVSSRLKKLGFSKLSQSFA